MAKKGTYISIPEDEYKEWENNVKWLARYIGTSKSQAIRVSVRNFAKTLGKGKDITKPATKIEIITKKIKKIDESYKKLKNKDFKDNKQKEINLEKVRAKREEYVEKLLRLSDGEDVKLNEYVFRKYVSPQKI